MANILAFPFKSGIHAAVFLFLSFIGFLSVYPHIQALGIETLTITFHMVAMLFISSLVVWLFL